MQYCTIISLDNNNSVKFSCSREDNSKTNDSMVMKIAHVQLHIYKHYVSIAEQYMQNCRRKAPDKIVSTDRWMDKWTAMPIPPQRSGGGYKNPKNFFP